LNFTDFDILLITNKVDRFSQFTSNRVKIFDYEKNFNEPIISANKFNMHLKRYPIKLASYMNYDYVYFHDCDCFIDGWDRLSYEKKCREDFDVAFVSHANPQLGGLRNTYKHFQDKIDLEFFGLYTEEMDLAPNPAETRVLFKNNEKLQNFISFWDKISEQNKNFFTYHDGVYFGTSSIYIDNVDPIFFNSYYYVTGNDSPDRDPVSWTLAVSNDNSTWTIINTQSNVVITDDRYAITQTFSI
jgi:hypothetical protein